MSDQPVHEEPTRDPLDPQVIHDQLPEDERAIFLERYRAAAHTAAEDLAGYHRLKNLLRGWATRAHMVSRPGYHDSLRAQIDVVHNGTIPTVPIQQVIAEKYGMSADEAEAYWQDNVERARLARQTKA